jgi:DNA modification methylase
VTDYQQLIRGSALNIPLRDETVQCVVTSPPYWGLRDYGTAEWVGGDADCDHQQGRPGAGRADGVVDERGQRNRDGVGSMGGDCRRCGARRIDAQLGLEATPEEYVSHIVDVFREVRRVLRSDGTLWLNLGDSYAGGKTGRSDHGVDDATVGLQGNSRGAVHVGYAKPRPVPPGLKPKDLVGIPWMVAFALRADGWWLRSDIIWAKPNPMPESVTDRPTKSHEYLFLLTKSERYFYDADAIREANSNPNLTEMQVDWRDRPNNGEWPVGTGGWMGSVQSGRNARSVWEIATQPYPEAHFATFPEELPRRCLLAGTAKGDTVLDPFCGSGTTGAVAVRHGRRFVGMDLSAEYLAMALNRIDPLGGHQADARHAAEAGDDHQIVMLV